MKTLLKIGSMIGLIMTALPAILYFAGKIPLETSHLCMVFGMVTWFLTAPFWINAKVNKTIN